MVLSVVQVHDARAAFFASRFEPEATANAIRSHWHPLRLRTLLNVHLILEESAVF